ncbi:4-hydroxythreonine-4-phosphate dehydrogenase PdxA [Metallibacterium sp.]|uniref:4-hydroxythreonine-4-phosphate dehydrogenase PdxA n=1 Tax=Metallibacterium sp. TaxID=2940281 RepID=UPI00262846BF|nr:4-hydroxythreonine-4-phosphate dehydrogenase PdxA [Metallibacterium sp.]
MHAALPRLLLTPGEPAGIGPELAVRLAHTDMAADLVACADPDLLRRAATRLGLPLHLSDADDQALGARARGRLRVLPVALAQQETPGHLDVRNAAYVLETLARASDTCRAGHYAALVTGPVHKGIINDAGIPFTGHTEFFAARAAADVLMLLAGPHLRIALATTHLPLAAVPAAITPERLRRVLGVLWRGLQRDFGMPAPRIAVLGLNPHAGENGHLGREEIDIIIPTLDTLRGAGMHLLGPLPADTAFAPAARARYDAVLAMYHDQALPVLKAEAFDTGVNITLGLPYVRTSVDHGTALDIAGHNRAEVNSLLSAARMALQLSARRAQAA